MDELFTKYQHELVILRSLFRDYAQRHPRVAAQLQMDGDTCNDPHMEHLIQSVALLNARITERLDDSFPQFTEALLNLLNPHLLRAFPSSSIARFIGEPGLCEEAGPVHDIPRGTLLESLPVDGVPCTFKTVYDVGPSRVVLAAASFETPIRAPIATRLPKDATASLTLRFETVQPGEPLSLDIASVLRLYASGDPSFCAALRDALFVAVRAAYVQLEDDGPWQRLTTIPVTPAGFTEDESLIPDEARSHPAYRLLFESFALPEKFNFIDIDLPSIAARLPPGCTHFDLRLALVGIGPACDKARMLASLSKQHLLQGCTPVINLFKQPGVPIDYNPLSSAYTLLANRNHPQAYEVYSIDRVALVSDRGNDVNASEFRPFYSLRHAAHDGLPRNRYWLMRHDETVALCNPGHEKSIALIDTNCVPLEIEKNTLSIDLACTNRDLPCALKPGALGGDLFIPSTTSKHVIQLLRQPTRPARLASGPSMQWRLISHIALNHHGLMQAGAEGLREMLTLYDLARSPVSRSQIAGITGLDHSDSTAWIKHRHGPSLTHGMEIRLTLDEEAYVGTGMYLFAQVLDRLFALYVPVTSFIELVILSRQSGKELFRCQPRSGNMPLI